MESGALKNVIETLNGIWELPGDTRSVLIF